MNYISFPKLNLYFNVDRTAFSLFGFNIYWYGVIIAFGLVVAMLTVLKLGKKAGIKQENILDVVIFGLPVSVICARAYYVIFEFDGYKDNLIEIFNIRNGGLAIYGGVIGAFLTVYVYCKIKKINVLKMFDIGSIGLVIGQMIGRWGNFFNQEAFGRNTKLVWGMTGSVIKSQLKNMQALGINVTPDLPVHPTFLYESLWWLVVAFVLITVFYKFRKFNGQIFFGYITLYSFGRFFIEGLRTDSLYLGSIRVSQLLAAVLVVSGITLYCVFYKKYKANINKTQDVSCLNNDNI